MVQRLVLLAVAASLVGCAATVDDSDWMATIDDARGLTELSIPGSHNSGALYESITGYSKNQNLPIAEQLAAGVRYLDIRCRHAEDRFFIHHGAFYQNQTFDEVLATLFAFLDAHPTEALVVSIMEESRPTTNTRSFEATFADYVSQAPDRWVLGATVPALGEVRGKLVLLRRFAVTTAPMGIDATAWPENMRSIVSIENAASIRVQDAFIVTSNDEKWGIIMEMIAEARTGSATTLFLNHTSGYQEIGGLSNIPIVSGDINARLDTLLADPANRHARLGAIVMDHVTPARVRAVFTTNDR